MSCYARMVTSVACLVGLLLLPTPARAQAVPGPCAPGALPHAALSLICVPSAGWNGELVVYAPGYTPPQLPLNFNYLNTPDGTPVPLLVQSLGYAFATTTFRKNGLAILEGADDIRNLVAAFSVVTHLTPTRVHVAGVSEGGLVATLLAERSPELFSSAWAACAPIGSFRQQVNYLGDFRALFDYYFPGVLPGSPVFMPEATPGVAWLAAWNTTYVPAIQNAFAGNSAKAFELMRVARVAHPPGNLTAAIASATAILAYNVLGLNDAIGTLGGNPYGNRFRWYFGSSNDLRLNLLVKRYEAAPAAVAAMGAYETDGDLSLPLVTIHTTGDDVAPFAHELLYLPKVDRTARGRFVPIPIARYGHCNFTATEIGLSFRYAATLP
jgi:pimeloyl-ACP methyl ester carboxylesterase